MYIDYKGVHNLNNPAATNQPVFNASNSNLNNLPTLYYNLDDYASKSFSNYLIGYSTGCIAGTFRTGSNVADFSPLFASSEIASTNKKVVVAYFSGKLRIIIRNTTSAGDRYEVDCDTTPILANTSYSYIVYQTGSGLKAIINGVSQTFSSVAGTSSTYWFLNVTGRVNVSIGGLIQSSPVYASQLTSHSVIILPYVSDAICLEFCNKLKTLIGL